jgi:dTDP-3-amino-3,4,6-trideoxy-alpha-D-glucose transaminase
VTGVPFRDLTRETADFTTEMSDAVLRVVRSGRYVLDREVEGFEQEWAAYCGTAHAIGVGSGLAAIELLLRAHGIGPGDEVLVPAFTFIGTWLGVSAAGATPVPVDVDHRTYNMDPAAAAAAVTARTSAVLAVHLFGLPAPMDELRAVADRHGLALFEDAAQAHGARYHGRRTGGLGDGAAFSLYPTKNLGALGDGGIVTTGSPEIAARIRRFRNYGMSRAYVHDEPGTNSRLDEIQAAVLRVKLRHLDRMNAVRQRVAADYLSMLSGPVALPAEPAASDPVWHIFSVRTPVRDELRHRLAAAGIETAVYYENLPHRSGAYRKAAPWPDLPVSERLAVTALALPCHPAAAAAPPLVASVLRDMGARATG